MIIQCQSSLLKSKYFAEALMVFVFSYAPLHQWISVPFALSNPAVSDITVSAKEAIYQSPWLGKIDPEDKWLWADNFCLLVRRHTKTQYITVEEAAFTF